MNNGNGNGWLEVVIEQMHLDLQELKADVKSLLEEKAETRGRLYVATGFIGFIATIATNLLVMWLKQKTLGG